MLRLIPVLLMAIASYSCFAQDTLAVIKALNDTPTSEVLTHGDSLLIRIVNVMDSESHWYYRGKDVGSPDLRFLGAKSLLAVQRKGDELYYYGYAHRGYKSLVKVLKAVNNKTAEAQDDFKLDGQIVGAMHRHGKVSIVTLHTEDKKVRLYEFDKAAPPTLLSEVAVNWPMSGLYIENTTLVGGLISRRLSQQLLKVFLTDTTMAVVFDDAFRDIETPGAVRKTLVARKDLVSGKQENEGFRAPEATTTSANSNKRVSRSRFKSFLIDNLLYQVTSADDKTKLIIRDLDKNTTTYEMEIPVAKGEDLYERRYDPAGVLKLNDKILTNYRLDPTDVSIEVKNINSEKLVTVSFTNEYIKGVDVKLMPIPGGGYIRPKDRPYIVVNYLVGSSEKGFVLASGDLLRRLQIVDEFEADNLTRRFDSFVHFTTNDSMIAAYSKKYSKRYVFIRFPNLRD